MPPAAPKKLPKIQSAEFITEARDVGGLPPTDMPEIAIAGRSNVGKSTLLNRLSGRRLLARTSKTPGRTRGVIFYQLKLKADGEDSRDLRLADLPGYGYAKVSKSERFGWGGLVEQYIEKSPRLSLVILLVDARRDFGDEERQLIEWLRAIGRRFCVVVTKVDKLNASEKGLCVPQMVKKMAPTKARVIPVSGQTGEGVDKLWPLLLRASADPEPAAAGAESRE